MKTYLFDTFNRFKRYSQRLDVKTILCDKAWWVFNDSGEKEVYIFKPDYSMIISVSGKVTRGKWEYLSANNSITISAADQEYMVHAVFTDQNILALNVDGTDNYAFLIDEKNIEQLKLKAYNDVVGYFEKMENEDKEQKAREKAREENNKRIKEAQKIYGELTSYDWWVIVFIVCIIDFTGLCIAIYNIDWIKPKWQYIYLFSILMGCFIIPIILTMYFRKKDKKKVIKYIEEHPNGIYNEYLEKLLKE